MNTTAPCMCLVFTAAVWLAALGGCHDGGAAGGSGSGRRGWTFEFMQPQLREEWTILCAEFANPDHHAYCEAFASTLRNTPGINSENVVCFHDDVHNHSQLTYGTYQREVDPQTNRLSTPPQLVEDMNLLQDLGDDAGRRAFPQMRMTRRGESYDSPPEWALIHSRDGQYSLQIAVFFPERGFNEPQRAAVEMVRQLRTEGLDAYYHHGAGRKSIVTVGTFGSEASAHMRLDAGGRTLYSAEVERLRNSDARFEFNYENGRKRSKILRGKKYPPYSFLVQIPRNTGQP